MNHLTHITTGKRLRIIFLLILSLFSTASPILPDSVKPGARHFLESLVYEHDSHEVGKTGFDITTVRKARSIARQLLAVTAEANRVQLMPALYAEWVRPGSYNFLYRLHPF